MGIVCSNCGLLRMCVSGPVGLKKGRWRCPVAKQKKEDALVVRNTDRVDSDFLKSISDISDAFLL